MKKAIAITLSGLVAVLSGCATIDVRGGGSRSHYPPLYPAVTWDCQGIEMFTAEGSTGERVWAIFFFGICDGPISLITDTLCLPWDLGCWCFQKEDPTDK